MREPGTSKNYQQSYLLQRFLSKKTSIMLTPCYIPELNQELNQAGCDFYSKFHGRCYDLVILEGLW